MGKAEAVRRRRKSGAMRFTVDRITRSVYWEKLCWAWRRRKVGEYSFLLCYCRWRVGVREKRD